MSTIHSLIEISYLDIDDQGFYIGSADLTDPNLSIRIMPGLETVCLQAIKTSGSLNIYRGTNLKIDGDLEIGAGIFSLGDIEATGNISGGLGILATGGVSAGGSIRCGGDIQTGRDLVSNGSIYAFGQIQAGGTINCSDSVSAKLGQLASGKNMIINGPVSAKTHVKAGGDIRCWSGISAGGEIQVKGLLHADGSIQAGNNIYADTLICGESVIAKGCVEVVHSLSSSRDIQAGYHIKACWLHASRIFAGLNDDMPWHREVRGEIQNGMLAYGQHVAA